MPIVNSKDTKFCKIIRDDGNILNTNPEDVSAGKYFVGSNKRIEVGTNPVHYISEDVILENDDSEYVVPIGNNINRYKIKSKPLSERTNGTAQANMILKGKTAWVNGQEITGTIESIDVNSINKSLSPGESTTIPYSVYMSESCTISAVPLENVTRGTVESNDILEGKTAWVNGQKITGTLESRPTPTNTSLNPGESYFIKHGIYREDFKITANDLTSSTQANALAEDILEGKTAWVNGQKITGTIQTYSKQTINLSPGNTYTIPKGNHPGTETVVSNVTTMDGFTITPSSTEQMFYVSGKYMTGDIRVTPVDISNNGERSLKLITKDRANYSDDTHIHFINQKGVIDFRDIFKQFRGSFVIPIIDFMDTQNGSNLNSIDFFGKLKLNDNNREYMIYNDGDSSYTYYELNDRLSKVDIISIRSNDTVNYSVSFRVVPRSVLIYRESGLYHIDDHTTYIDPSNSRYSSEEIFGDEYIILNKRGEKITKYETTRHEEGLNPGIYLEVNMSKNFAYSHNFGKGDNLNLSNIDQSFYVYNYHYTDEFAIKNIN